MTRDGLTITGVNRATIGTLLTLGPALTLALLVVTIGTDLIDFIVFTGSTHEVTGSPKLYVPVIIAASAFRVLAVFWVSYVVQRRLTGARDAFRLGMPLLRFVAIQILILAGSALVRWPLMRLFPPHESLASAWLVNFVGTAIWSILAIRLLAWNAGMAAGEPFSAIPRLWRGLAERDFILTAAMFGLVLPVAALHLGFTLTVVRMPMAMSSKLTFAVIDGLVSALELGLVSALGAVALRLAGPIEAIARPR